mgnify:FL=1
MNVSKLIKDLQALDPQEEIIVAYWDKEFISDLHDLKITPEVWSETVSKFENGEFGWQAGADECIVEIIEEVSA